MKKRDEKKCDILKDIIRVDFLISKGILNSTKVCLKKELSRKERERIDKCLRKKKLNVVWSKKCFLVR